MTGEQIAGLSLLIQALNELLWASHRVSLFPTEHVSVYMCKHLLLGALTQKVSSMVASFSVFISIYTIQLELLVH